MTPDAPVLVLGMHRSGTSCLAGCLQELGLHLGEVHVWSPHNLKGNRERRDVMALNEALLHDHGGRWDAPLVVDGGSIEQQRERDRIIAALESGGRPWGFKDPRTLFTLSFWQSALPAAPRLIGTFRQPLAVAASLTARNGFSQERGLTLWAQYNERLLALAEQQGLPLISFDLPDAGYRQRVQQLAAWLQLPGAMRAEATRPGFFEPLLRRQTPTSDDCPPPYRQLQQRLLNHAAAFWSALP